MAAIVFLHPAPNATLAVMTTPRPRSARRSNAQYRWTRDKALAFLHALARGQSVAEAARSVGMGRQGAYRLRARLGEGFAEIWEEGRLLAQGDMQGDTRAVQGDTPTAQGDTQGDTSHRKATPKETHPPQGDTALP